MGRPQPADPEQDHESLSCRAVRALADPVDFSIAAENRDMVARLLARARDREALFLRQYFGLDGESAHTLLELSIVHGISSGRATQIVNKALRRIKLSPTAVMMREAKPKPPEIIETQKPRRDAPLLHLPLKFDQRLFDHPQWNLYKRRAADALRFVQLRHTPLRKAPWGPSLQTTDPRVAAWGQHQFEIIALTFECLKLEPPHDAILHIILAMLRYPFKDQIPLVETLITVLLIDALPENPAT
jgi:hypothetical protein